MSEQGGGSRTAAERAELLSIPRFLEELRRIPRYRAGPPIGDPLDAVVKKIEKDPSFTQSRLLTRILAALTYQQGEFRRAEVSTLDADTLAMVIMLIDKHAAGTATREEWVCAVELAQAAELAVR